MTNDRNRGAVSAHVDDLAKHIQALPGVGAVFSREALREVLGLLNFTESLGGPSRRLTARMLALREVLEASCRVDATKVAGIALEDLRFEQEFDTETTATMLGIKEDTLRKYLREGRIHGRIVNGRWMVPLSAIVEYQSTKAA